MKRTYTIVSLGVDGVLRTQSLNFDPGEAFLVAEWAATSPMICVDGRGLDDPAHGRTLTFFRVKIHHPGLRRPRTVFAQADNKLAAEARAIGWIQDRFATMLRKWFPEHP